MATSFWEQRPSGRPVFHSGAQFPHPHRQPTFTADFNGVGNSDLAIMDFYQNAVTILLRNGNGTFTQGTTIFGVGTILVSFPTSPRNASGRKPRNRQAELTPLSVPPISAAAGLGSKAYEQGVQY